VNIITDPTASSKTQSLEIRAGAAPVHWQIQWKSIFQYIGIRPAGKCLISQGSLGRIKAVKCLKSLGFYHGPK
jgi:hypothetical protein